MAKAVTVPLGPAQVNLVGVRAGDRNLLTVTIRDKDLPVDLTGMVVSAQARKRTTDSDMALTANCTIVNAAAGQVEIRWPGADVRTLLADKPTWSGVWDLQMQSPPADPVTVCEGTFDAEMDVTRS
jgi:hypothetical protein